MLFCLTFLVICSMIKVTDYKVRNNAMIINFKRTIAYVCSGCGETTFGDFSLFELSGGRGISVSCDCSKSSLKISTKDGKTYIVSVKCQACEKVHEYAVPLTDLLHKRFLDFVCPELLMGLVFIGDSDNVRHAVEENDKYVKEILTTCGIEHAGKNGIAILKALDKIQLLSDTGGVVCECGSDIIDLDVLENGIVLECCTCGATAFFTADDIRKENFSDITEILISKKDEK